MALKLEKWAAPLKFPIGAFSTAGVCFVTSLDKLVAQAKHGDFVVHASVDLERWNEVLRHPTVCHAVVAFGGLTVQRDGKLVWSPDGAQWTELATPSAFVASDGTGGLWSLGKTLARRRRDDTTFASVPVEPLPASVVACEGLTLFGGDGAWWRLTEAGDCEPVPTLKRRRVQHLVRAGELVAAIVDERLWRSTDGGRSFVSCELALPALCLGFVDRRLVVGGRGAVVSSPDARTFSVVSENPEAEFSSLAPVGVGALVADPRRHRLFGLAEKGQRPAFSSTPAPAREHPELSNARRRFAELEAPVLARRTSPLEHMRTQAERLAPSPGFQPQLVYLDALQEAGDPAAPHLAMLNRLQQGPRFKQYLDEHRAELFGGVTLAVEVLRSPSVEWKSGFLHRAGLHVSSLPTFFAQTSSHLLRSLATWSRDSSTPGLSALWDTVRALRRLSLDGREFDDGRIAVAWGDLTPLWPALGQLETLFLSGEVTRFGPVVLPALAELTLILEGATPYAELGGLVAPNLETLQLGLECRAAPWLNELLERDAWPRLRKVHLGGSFVRPWLERGLAGAWLASLEVLDLRGNALTDDSVERLRNGLPRRLQRLQLSGNCLTPAGVERAASLAHRVDADRQHPTAEVEWPPEWFPG